MFIVSPRARSSAVAVERPRNSQINVDPLPRMLGFMLRRAQTAVVGEFLEIMGELDLRPTQFSTLLVIGANPGVRQTEVCAAIGLQKTNFVPLLNKLEKRRLTVRKPTTADRRAYSLFLTLQGEAVLKRARQLQDEHEARMTERLGAAGREQLIELLSKLMPKSLPDDVSLEE